MGTPSKRGGLHNAAHYTETSGDRKLTPGPWRWKTHQFTYGEPEYDYLYSIVNGEQVLRPTGTDNPIAVDTEHPTLFTEVRGIGILGSSLAGSWIKPRNTPPRWPWDGSIHARGGRYYLRLDAYAGLWILPAVG